MNNYFSYFIKKVVYMAGFLLLLSFFVFILSRGVPGDPLRAFYGDGIERMNEEEKVKARESLGLDEAIFIQYAKWLKNAVKGNFGISYKYKQEVWEVIQDRIGNSLLLGGVSFIFVFILGIILSMLCAVNANGKVDRFICKIGTISNCIPSFWVAMVLLYFFAVKWGMLPSSGAYGMGDEGIGNRIRHLLLPVLVIVIGHIWYYAYILRNKLLEEKTRSYAVFAISKGCSRQRMLFRHCLPNVYPSLFSLMAVALPHIVGGTYIVEQIFSYPGLGMLSFESAKYHDYNLLMLLCILTGGVVFISNMAAEFIGKLADKRI